MSTDRYMHLITSLRTGRVGDHERPHKPTLLLVEAAHLVPWTISRDDDPRNGIALCKNHHWAMDRYVIAPSPQPERTWKVSSVLDDRIEGQRDMLNLHGRSILLPREERFHPRDDGLAWRMGRLLRA